MPCVWGELQRFCCPFVFLTLVQPSMLAQTCSNKLAASTQQEWRNHLFYRFPALPSRITLLTLASCFLIGLAIDCPPSSLLPSRWPITNKHSLLEVHSNPKKTCPHFCLSMSAVALCAFILLSYYWELSGYLSYNWPNKDGQIYHRLRRKHNYFSGPRVL